jgi:endonuclease YncB( thermonuclease family)
MNNRMKAAACFAAALLAAGPAWAQWREPQRSMTPAPRTYTGCRAVDGDTLACQQGRVRLRGVDAPERGQRGYREAQRELQRRMGGNSVVVTPHHRDRYGRVVGDAAAPRGPNIGRGMDRDGWSKPQGARR